MTWKCRNRRDRKEKGGQQARAEKPTPVPFLSIVKAYLCKDEENDRRISKEIFCTPHQNGEWMLRICKVSAMSSIVSLVWLSIEWKIRFNWSVVSVAKDLLSLNMAHERRGIGTGRSFLISILAFLRVRVSENNPCCRYWSYPKSKALSVFVILYTSQIHRNR